MVVSVIVKCFGVGVCTRSEEVYDAHIHRPYSVGISKLSDGPLELNDLDQVNVSGFSQGEPPQLIREGAQMHAFLELSEKIAEGFLVSDNVYKNVQWTDTGDTLMVALSWISQEAGGRIDRENTSHRISSENSLWHQRPSLHRDASVHYHDMRMVSLDNSFRKESPRDNEFAVLAEKYDLPRDPTHIDYRERSRSPLRTDCGFFWTNILIWSEFRKFAKN